MSKDWSSTEGYTMVTAMEESGGVGIKIFVKVSGLNSSDVKSLFHYDLEIPYVRSDVEDLCERVHVVQRLRDPKLETQKAELRAEIQETFVRSGIAPVYIEEIPNQYCTLHCCLHRPWFRVTSSLGTIQIGWRKSVINIDWSSADPRTRRRKTPEFITDDVTRGDAFVHAWGYEKAVEYLTSLKAEFLA